MKIKRLPKILALHLKRFRYTEDLQKLQKLFHQVVYPYHLRLFNTTDDAEDPDRLYELYAVVVHIGGGPYHGHYVSIVKTEDRGWLLFDDEMVEPVDKSYVQNFFGDRPGLACAYVLFYQETTVEAVKREQDAESAAAAANTVVEVPKEPVGLGLKTNGFMNGIQHVRSAVSPTSDFDGLDNLDKAATEPRPHIAPIQYPNEVTALPSMPAPDAPISNPNEEIKSKKELAREEKERKAVARDAAKEEEKAERARRKTLELKRKDNLKQQEGQMKAAMEASKASKLEEDQRLLVENGSAAGSISGGLSRFKTSSKSFKKPKFLGGSREVGKEEPIAAANEIVGTDLSGLQPPEAIDQPVERPKNRFSSLGLRRKASSMIL